MIVLDSSALLAALFDEPGADVVAVSLTQCVVPVAAWAEVGAKLSDRGRDGVRDLAGGVLAKIEVESHLPVDALRATELRDHDRAQGKGFPRLSLADRLILATAMRLEVPVLTADSVWAELDLGLDVHLIR